VIKVNDLKLIAHNYHNRRVKIYNPTRGEFDRVIKKAVSFHKSLLIPKIVIQDIPNNLNNKNTPYFSYLSPTIKSRKKAKLLFYRYPILQLVSSSDELVNLVNNVILNLTSLIEKKEK
jgi:hypothetical protein